MPIFLKLKIHTRDNSIFFTELFSFSDPLDLGIDDDQHDYDSVASDEDTDSELTTQNNNNTQRSNRAKVQTQTWASVSMLPPLLF